MFLGRRIALALATTGVVAALVSGVSFALFTSDAGNQSNTFTAGTVTLTQTPAFSCQTSNNMAPGDTDTCTYGVSYTGSLPAWIGADTTTSGSIFTGATPATVSITDSQPTPQTYNDNLANQLVGTSAVNSGWTDTFTIAVTLPSGAGNTYQGESGTVSLDVHAVQSTNNNANPGPGPSAW